MKNSWHYYKDLPTFLRACCVKNKCNGCWDWTRARLAAGYGQVSYKGRRMLAHRLSYEVYYGAVPDGVMVCHGCDNPGCINPKHLFLGDAKVNLLDAISKGRHLNGFPEYATKKNRIRHLTNEQVLDIRSSTESRRVLAHRHKVSSTYIYLIRSGKRKKLV